MARSTRDPVTLDPAALDALRMDERRYQFFNSASFRDSIDQVASNPSFRTEDSFQNFQLQLGMGTDNALTGSTYGFNPITRNRTLLEFMYRGSWLAGAVINLVGEDMTRAGIEITSKMSPDDIDKIHNEATQRHVWTSINDTVCWARLYGGAIAVLLIDGQKTDTPLRIHTVGKRQFRGLLSLDRWMVEPSSELIDHLGPDMGMPKYYKIGSSAPGLRGKVVHHSRCLRLEGIAMPYTQRMMENLWGISVLERLYDRMVAFDSATAGAAQMLYKSYLRTYRIKDLRKAIATGGEILGQVVEYVQMMRRYQGIEGITLLDSEDEFEAQQGARFNGMSDALIQFGQQIAGAAQVPMVRLFGMSPAGLNSTGEADLKTYYDGIAKRQERDLRVPVHQIYRVIARSEGIDVGQDFSFAFNPLWQMTAVEKSQVAATISGAIDQAMAGGVIDHATALKELKQSSKITGVFSNITDEDVENARNEAPPGPPGMEGGMPGMEGGAPPGMPGMEGPPPGDPNQMPPDQGGDPNQPPGDGLEQDSRKKHLHLHVVRDALPGLVPGLEIVIETPQGASRYPWRSQLGAHYGFIRNTTAPDGEECDCFVGPEPDGNHDAWAIEQLKPDTGSFDEWKLMLGFPNRQTALRAYGKSFDDGSATARVGSCTKVAMPELQDWLKQHASRNKLRPSKAVTMGEVPLMPEMPAAE